MSGHHRSMKNYVLDAGYQIRFTGFMVLMAALLMAGLGMGVMHMVRSAAKTKANNIRMFAADPEPRIAELEQRQRTIGWSLAGTGVVLCGALFAYGIWLTHKTAGPVHKVGQYLDEMRAGRYVEVRPLRRGDHLKEFFEHFKEAHDALRRRQEQDVKLLRDLVDDIRRAGLEHRTDTVARRLDALEQLAQEKESGLG